MPQSYPQTSIARILTRMVSESSTASTAWITIAILLGCSQKALAQRPLLTARG
jgi:hypothetical protein